MSEWKEIRVANTKTCIRRAADFTSDAIGQRNNNKGDIAATLNLSFALNLCYNLYVGTYIIKAARRVRIADSTTLRLKYRK